MSREEAREGDGFQTGVSHSLVKAARAVPSLAPLDDATLLRLVGDSANLFWAAESLVFEKGSPADNLYIVITGKVRIFDEGSELAVLGPGDFFGEFALLLGTEHHFEARAAQDSELMVVPKECLDELMSANPELARSVRSKLEERMAENLRRSVPSA